MTDVLTIARCPEHGLHGCRDTCFECGGPVEQVAMVEVGRTFPRYRAVAVDRGEGGDDFEYGTTVSTRYMAQLELDELLHDADPPYDDGWIETCRITNWEKAQSDG